MFDKKFLIIIIGAIGFYSVFLAFSDIKLVLEHLNSFQIQFIPLILALIFLSWMCLAARWSFLLKKQNVNLSFKNNILIYLSGFALAISPGKSGELVKSLILKEKFNVSRAITVPLVVVERFYDILIALIFAIIGIWFLGINFLPIIIIAIFLLVFVISVVFSKKLFSSFLKICNKFKFISKYIDPLQNSQKIIQQSLKNKIILSSVFFTILFRLVESLAVYVILLAFGINLLDYFQISVTYAISIILGNVSLIPGGVGVTEGSLASLFSYFGLELTASIVIVIVIRFFTLWYAIIVGFLAMKILGVLSIKPTND